MGVCKDCKYFDKGVNSKIAEPAFCNAEWEGWDLTFKSLYIGIKQSETFGCSRFEAREQPKQELICKNIDFNATC